MVARPAWGPTAQETLFEPATAKVSLELVVHAPWRFAPGRCEQNMSLVDLLPTLTDLAGMDAREGVPAPMFMVKQGQHRLMTGGGVAPSLFDLASDPHERRDLAKEPSYRDVGARLEAHALGRWNSERLDGEIRLSQRRRLVRDAHRHGAESVLEHQPGDATTPWLLRGEGLYNDWAWQGIE